jgi:hypothetical protein
VPVTADGSYTLSATATDYAGRTTTATQNIGIDRTPPDATFALVGTNNPVSSYFARTGDIVTVKGTALDASGYLASVYMQFGTGPSSPTTGLSVFESTYLLNGSEAEGVLPIVVTVADLAGNVFKRTDNTIMVDNTLPNVDSVTINGTVYTSGGHLTLMTGTSCTIAVSCTDSGSGVSGVSLDGSSYSPNGTPLNFDVVDGDTMLIIYARDNAGNVTGPGGFQVTITGSGT